MWFILLLLSIGLWLVSYLRIEYQSPTTRTIVTSGTVWRIPTKQKYGGLSINGFHWYDQHGFYRGFTTYWMPTKRPYVRIPLWIPTAVFALCFWGPYYLPIRRVRMRPQKGLCVNCGYCLKSYCKTLYMTFNREPISHDRSVPQRVGETPRNSCRFARSTVAIGDDG